MKLALVDRLLPRPRDLFPALIGSFLGLGPLMGFRIWLLKDRLWPIPLEDLWSVNRQEILTWTIVAILGSYWLRCFSGASHRLARLAYHGACTALLLGTATELAYWQITGSHADPDIIRYFIVNGSEVLPIVAAEVRTWHKAGLLAILAVGLAPVLLPSPRSGSPLPGRLLPLFALPLVVGLLLRPSQIDDTSHGMSYALLPLLWTNTMDRLDDFTIPPDPAEPELAIGPPSVERPLPNIVLIILESVAARNVSPYNPDLPITPHLQRLAEQGLLVRNAFTVVPHTSKALVAILCGQYPELVETINEERMGGLPGRCLPELLNETGYRTAYFQTANENFEKRYALVHEMEFQRFLSRSALWRVPFLEKIDGFGIEDDAMLDPGIGWSIAEEGPFFATYLTMATHANYGTPWRFEKLPFPEIERDDYRQYLNAVRYVDAFVGKLIAAYEAHGLADNTLFILIGDHGEGFAEHGINYHDINIYEEGLKVPLILYGPGVLGGRTGEILGNRQNIDILPTVLDFLGVQVQRGELEGSSLLRDSPSDRVLFHSCWRPFRCLASRDENTKFIDNYRKSGTNDFDSLVFDLRSDPQERVDLAPVTHPASLRARSAAVRTWRAEVNGRYQFRRERFLSGLLTLDDRPALASWGGVMDLLSATIEEGDVERSGSVWVHLRWRLRESLSSPWKTSVSLWGDEMIASQDAAPVDGLLPVWKWEPGVAIDDQARVAVPSAARLGTCQVKVGWLGVSGQPVMLDGMNGKDAFTVGTITVRALDHMVVPQLEGP